MYTFVSKVPAEKDANVPGADVPENVPETFCTGVYALFGESLWGLPKQMNI